MKTTYILTKKEIAFLRALNKKPYPKNCWSGRGGDDLFKSKWENEIETFTKNKLTEKKDDGHYDSYWCYGLNERGMELQKKYV